MVAFFIFSGMKWLIRYRFLIWFLVLAIKAAFTELFHDEAYYWAWSEQLDWGYFDHPPMIALFIKLGTFFGHHEFFVRIAVVLANVGAIFLLEKIIQPSNLVLFWQLIFSVVVLQIGGIMSVPDAPLLFFSIVFFYLLHLQLEKEAWWKTILLGLTTSAVLYSKYHGVLLLFFSLLAIPQWWKKRWLYAVASVAAIAYLPHLWWQYDHEFMTLQYHFFDRSIGESFNLFYLLDYIMGQLFFTGPLLGWLFIFLLFKTSPTNTTERAMKWTAVGVFSFFAMMSIKGKVEANWTNLALFPMIAMSYRGLEHSEKWKRIVKWNAIVLLPLLMIVHLYMMVDFLPKKWHLKTQFHGWDDWAKTIANKAGERNVLFMNNYQQAAKFKFYTGINSISQSNTMGRKSQYDLWDNEKEMIGQPMLYVLNWYDTSFDNIETNHGTLSTLSFDTFVTYSPVWIEQQNKINNISFNDSINLHYELKHSFRKIPIPNAGYEPVLSIQFFEGRKPVKEYIAEGNLTTDFFDQKQHASSIKIEGLKPGVYSYYYTIKAGWLPNHISSKRYRIKVE